MGNTTVEDIQKYILNNYGLDFKFETIGTHRYITYSKKNITYEFMCMYCHPNNEEIWSIYHSYFDSNKWYGYDAAEEDMGFEVIDKWMTKWGFTKKGNQLSLF